MMTKWANIDSGIINADLFKFIAWGLRSFIVAKSTTLNFHAYLRNNNLII